MMHFRHSLAVLVLACAAPGWAQTPPAPATSEPAPSSDRVDFGRRSSAAADSALATPGQTSTPSEAAFDIKVFAYMRVLGSMVQDDPEVAFVGRNDGFQLQNARVGLEGRIRDRVYVRISADGADDQRNAPNDVEGTLRFALADAFADVRALPALEVRAGRFPVIFDLERFVSAAQRSFIDRALESRGVAPTEGFETPGLGVERNLGVALRSPQAYRTGAFSLGYEIAAQNGNGELDAANDNDALAYSGSLISYIADTALIFASVRYNQRTEGELPFRRTENDLGTAFGLWVESDYLRVAGQLIFQRTTFPTTGTGSENAWGGHAEVVAKVPGLRGFTAGYRYALLDDSDRMPNNRIQEHTAGAGYEMPELGLRFKLNLTLPVEQAGRELDNFRGDALVEVSL